TGALNQAQLMRLLGTASARTQQVSGAHGWTDPFGRERLFIDVEGRQIAFTQMGAPAGRPAILVHGPMTGYVLPDVIEDGLRVHDITLWAVSRPGFGNSDPDPHRSALDGGALCIEAVMNHLNIRKCAGIGLICGLAPLARFAAQQPERITSLLGIGSSAPLDKIQSQKALPSLQRVVINLARLSPKALEVVYLQAVLAAAQSDLASVVRRMYGQCASDTALLKDSKIMEQLTVGAEMITAQDSRVFLKDLQMMSQPWDKDLERTNVPCRMIGGAQDPVFPPHIAAALCADTGADLNILENAGQLIAFQHPEATLDAIRQAVA
ncbi:MAG: alpha/beta hydrolase, partial [Pseudomonadota bacterium]